MAWRDTRAQWGGITRLLHWSLALLLLAMLVLGWWMTRLDYYHPLYQLLPRVHRSLGLLLALPLLFRLVWRLSNPRPALPADPLERRLAQIVQWLLLLLPILSVVSGYLFATADGRPVALFDWLELPAPGPQIEGLDETAGDIHAWLGYLLGGAILLHLAGALKHHFMDRDATLKKMLW